MKLHITQAVSRATHCQPYPNAIHNSILITRSGLYKCLQNEPIDNRKFYTRSWKVSAGVPMNYLCADNDDVLKMRESYRPWIIAKHSTNERRSIYHAGIVSPHYFSLLSGLLRRVLRSIVIAFTSDECKIKTTGVLCAKSKGICSREFYYYTMCVIVLELTRNPHKSRPARSKNGLRLWENKNFLFSQNQTEFAPFKLSLSKFFGRFFVFSFG